MLNLYLKFAFFLSIFLPLFGQAWPISPCGRYLTLEEKLVKFRELEMPILGKELNLLKDWYQEVRRKPSHPNPNFFLSHEELEEYQQMLDAYYENEDFANDNPLLPFYYLNHHILPAKDEILLLKTYRNTRDHDLKNGRVQPVEFRKAKELSELQKEALKKLPEGINLTPRQWQLLEKYHVPLAGCELPLSVQIGKILLRHNLKFIATLFKPYSSRIKNKTEVFFDLFEESSRAFEKYLALFRLGEGANLRTYMYQRIRSTVQEVIRGSAPNYLPSNYWYLVALWKKASQFTQEKLGQSSVTPEEIHEAYPSFLAKHIEKNRRNTQRPVSGLVKEKLKREKYENKEEFLKKRIDMTLKFDGLSSFKSFRFRSSEDDEEDKWDPPTPDSYDDGTQVDTQKVARALGEFSPLNSNEKIIMKLLYGFLSSEEVFLLVKSQFAGKLSDAEHQVRWLNLFIREYFFEKAKKLKWPLVFSKEVADAFEEILEMEWNNGEKTSPFYKIHLLLQKEILPKCKSFSDENFLVRVSQWTQFLPTLNEKTSGFLLDMSRERVRQIKNEAHEKLAEILSSKEHE